MKRLSVLCVALLAFSPGCSGGTGGTGGGTGGTGGGSGTGGGGEVILDYSFGNQITRSTLTVFETGQIDHREKSSGGGMFVPVAEAALTGSALTELKDRVNLVRQGTVSVSTDAGGALGASTGFLVVGLSDGGTKAVRSIAFDPQNTMNLVTTQSSASSAPLLLDFVRAKVTQDIP